MLPEKVITTVSGYNGLQVSIEAKFGETWRYLAFGFHDGFDLQYSHATPDDVDDTMRIAASEQGEDPVRYAASNRMTGNFRTIIDTREAP